MIVEFIIISAVETFAVISWLLVVGVIVLLTINVVDVVGFIAGKTMLKSFLVVKCFLRHLMQYFTNYCEDLTRFLVWGKAKDLSQMRGFKMTIQTHYFYRVHELN